MDSCYRIIVSLVAITLAVGAYAATPGVDDHALADQAARADFERAAAILADIGAPERFGAAHALVNLATGDGALAREAAGLLEGLVRDPDPEIACLASDTLYALDLRAERLATQPPESRSDTELQKLSAQQEFEEITAALTDPHAPERYGAIHALANLAQTSLIDPDEMRDLLLWARSDDDFEIAREAETALARLDSRPIDPAFITTPSGPLMEEVAVAGDPVVNLLALSASPDGQIRYGALVELMEIALSDGRTSDPHIVKAFNDALSDPNPNVSSYAWFAVNGGLAGDENALRQVYVGPAPAAVVGGEEQPLSPEVTAGGMHEGSVDEYGMFIGVTGPSFGDEVQPLSSEPVFESQHDGHLDEYGVFVGVTNPSSDGEDQPQ